jgi:hypothetical protein
LAPITASELTGAANCTVRFNHLERMIRPNPLLKLKRLPQYPIVAAHRHPPFSTLKDHNAQIRPPLFCTPARRLAEAQLL